MKSKARAIREYFEKFADFPCGCTALPDLSNVYASKETRSDGTMRWRIRCLDCHRAKSAHYAKKRRRALKRAKKRG